MCMVKSLKTHIEHFVFFFYLSNWETWIRKTRRDKYHILFNFWSDKKTTTDVLNTICAQLYAWIIDTGMHVCSDCNNVANHSSELFEYFIRSKWAGGEKKKHRTHLETIDQHCKHSDSSEWNTMTFELVSLVSCNLKPSLMVACGVHSKNQLFFLC